MSDPHVEELVTPNPATTNWVPVGPGPMPDFRYRGDFVTATNYYDGDIVVYNGVAYLCVLPTTASPSGWSPPSISPTYGIAFPTTPNDGAEHVLVDSVTNPSYQWRFRYNAQSTSAYKWEFIGGSSIVVGPQGAINNVQNSTGQADLTGGPTVTLPRAGDYQIGLGVFISNGGTQNGASIGSGLAVVGATTLVSVTMYCAIAWQSIDVFRVGKAAGRTAGDVVKIQVTNNGGATQLLNFTQGTLIVTPVRVS